MKRNKNRGKVATKIWNLFIWEYCLSCEKEFRREWGWRCRKDLPIYVNQRSDHVCFSCAKTAEDAIKLVKNHYMKILAKKPFLPTAPPKTQ